MRICSKSHDLMGTALFTKIIHKIVGHCMLFAISSTSEELNALNTAFPFSNSVLSI